MEHGKSPQQPKEQVANLRFAPQSRNTNIRSPVPWPSNPTASTQPVPGLHQYRSVHPPRSLPLGEPWMSDKPAPLRQNCSAANRSPPFNQPSLPSRGALMSTNLPRAPDRKKTSNLFYSAEPIASGLSFVLMESLRFWNPGLDWRKSCNLYCWLLLARNFSAIAQSICHFSIDCACETKHVFIKSCVEQAYSRQCVLIISNLYFPRSKGTSLLLLR